MLRTRAVWMISLCANTDFKRSSSEKAQQVSKISNTNSPTQRSKTPWRIWTRTVTTKATQSWSSLQCPKPQTSQSRQSSTIISSWSILSAAAMKIWLTSSSQTIPADSVTSMERMGKDLALSQIWLTRWHFSMQQQGEIRCALSKAP